MFFGIFDKMYTLQSIIAHNAPGWGFLKEDATWNMLKVKLRPSYLIWMVQLSIQKPLGKKLR